MFGRNGKMITYKTMQYLKVRNNTNYNSLLSKQGIRKVNSFQRRLNCSIFSANTLEEQLFMCDVKTNVHAHKPEIKRIASTISSIKESTLNY